MIQQGGSSGSPVIDESSNEDLVIAIHTHGTCSTSETSGNTGTRIDKLDLAEHINFLTQACNQDIDCSDYIFCNGMLYIHYVYLMAAILTKPLTNIFLFLILKYDRRRNL